jgi:hypothetical protein
MATTARLPQILEVKPLEAVIFMRFAPGYKRRGICQTRLSLACISGRAGLEPEEALPCGGGVEYLHRNPASRRRRLKGKSRI